MQGEQEPCGRSVRAGGGRNLPGARNITKGGFSLSSVSPVSYIRLSATCFSVNFRRPGKHRGLYLSPSIFFRRRERVRREGREDRRCSVACLLSLARLLWERKKKKEHLQFFSSSWQGNREAEASCTYPWIKVSLDKCYTWMYTFLGTGTGASTLSEAALGPTRI